MKIITMDQARNEAILRVKNYSKSVPISGLSSWSSFPLQLFPSSPLISRSLTSACMDLTANNDDDDGGGDGYLGWPDCIGDIFEELQVSQITSRFY